MITNFNKILASVLLFGLFGGLKAQDADIFQKMKSKYPKEDAVIYHKKESISIENSPSKGLSISSSHTNSKYFLSERSHYYADEYMFFNSFNTIDNIKAYAFQQSEGKYKKKKVTDTIVENRYSTSIFYDDNKTMRVIYPKMKEGDFSRISYTEEYKDPHFLSSFYFSSYLPSEKAEISISFPKSVKVKYKEINFNDNIHFQKSESKDAYTYTWTAMNTPKYGDTEESFSMSYYEPHVSFMIESYEHKGKEEKILSDTKDLYNWYYSLVKNVNKEPAIELQKLTDSITNGIDDDFEKIKTVYYWVQDNIRYVAFEDGYSGFIPRNAKDIFHRRYGDCKDMASIITKMLNYADVPAYLTWIGTRDIPYTYEEMHSPSVDNHMIAAAEYNDSIIFLDGTASFLPIDLPSSFVQGKQAMIGMGKNKFMLKTVPEIPREQNIYKDSVSITIKDLVIHGQASALFTGYHKYDLAAVLKRRPESKYKEILAGTLEKASNKFSLDTVSVKGLEKREAPLILTYSFHVPSYVKQNGNELYVNLNLNKDYGSAKIDIDKTKFDKMVDYMPTDSFITILNIPEGYSVEYIPENVEYAGKYFGFQLEYEYSPEKNTIRQTRTMHVDALQIPRSEFKSWNEMIKKLNRAYGQTISLKKK